MTTTHLDETKQRIENNPLGNEQGPFFTRKLLVGLGCFGMLISAMGVGVLWSGDHDALKFSRDNAKREAEVNAKKAQAALWAAKVGIKQIVDVDAESSVQPIVRLSTDPNNPKACTVSFEFTGQSLALKQSDAAGQIYDTVQVASGERAEEVLNDICPPAKP